MSNGRTRQCLHRLTVASSLALALGVSGPSWASDGERGGNPKNTFNIMMNYELGMHCTGFEFAYCCILPPYNSILAQVVKTQQRNQGEGAFAKLLEGDPNEGLDGLGRQTVLRDADLRNGEFQKYVLEYWHDAQPRENAPNVVPQTSTLISATEGNSLLMWNTLADSAAVNPDGSLKLAGQDGNPAWNGATGVMLGDGDFNDPTDNYWNAVWNHLYIYEGLEGHNPHNSTAEADKIRLGVAGHIEYPVDCGAGLHPMGPVTHPDGLPTNPTVPNDCGGASNGNVLTFSGEEGTVVYTQMKVLENLPVTLTSPRIWEALGLPLTPFEDSINFFADPGAMYEESVRPFVAMKARLRRYDPTQPGGMGEPVLQNGQPVEGFGTAPIDIPNCERCHSNETGTNSPHTKHPDVWTKVQQEYEFWLSYYQIDPATESDWYPRLKSAAISILGLHDANHGTDFLAEYPACSTPAECDNLAAELSAENNRPVFAQSTRIGNTSVTCQRCHADNVIAQVKSATKLADGELIKPMSEAIHQTHRGTGEGGPIVFTDGFGRFGGCQGCHPAHRSSGDMAGYPITEQGDNFYASTDNRLGSGGCFVGRDVHSNPFKDIDGAETPEHLNAVGDWLVENVFRNQGGLTGSDRDMRGLWCTNCHNQLSQEIWKNENMEDLVHEVPGPGATNIRALGSLDEIAAAVGVSTQQAIDWLDPRDPNVAAADGAIRTAEETMGIWRNDPGLCAHVEVLFGADPIPAMDANVATIEVALPGQACSTGGSADGPDCDNNGSPDFQICGTFDDDVPPDFSVNILDFCTTDDCVTAAQGTLTNSAAVPVPFSAATDGRDHWLAAGEPHCADCHEAPYVEQSGNINAFPPFNYPRKASLMRYSRGHRDITCQGCHESIHGLYPVAPSLTEGPGIPGVDTTSYAQAASMNSDDSHGPLKCGACHQVNSSGVHDRMDDLVYDGVSVRRDLDAAIGWAHVFTEEHSPLDDMCVNCHGDERDEVRPRDETWQEHAMKGRASRPMMDQVEIELLGAIAGTNVDGSLNVSEARNQLCEACHGDEWRSVSCSGSDGREWKRHLSEGRVSPVVWEQVTDLRTGSTCGW